MLRSLDGGSCNEVRKQAVSSSSVVSMGSVLLSGGVRQSMELAEDQHTPEKLNELMGTDLSSGTGRLCRETFETLVARTSGLPQEVASLGIVCVSDTHDMFRDLKAPEGDLLLHAGDLSRTGRHRARLPGSVSQGPGGAACPSSFWAWFCRKEGLETLFINACGSSLGYKTIQSPLVLDWADGVLSMTAQGGTEHGCSKILGAHRRSQAVGLYQHRRQIRSGGTPRATERAAARPCLCITLTADGRR